MQQPWFHFIVCCAFSTFLPDFSTQHATHLIFNSKNGRIEAVDDSPYLVQQPHSLHEFLNQIQWVQELSELKASIKQEQVLIERRYDKDDPGIEQKLRETNEDCIRSKSMELETEQFLTHYPINLMKFGRDTEDQDETRLTPRPADELFFAMLEEMPVEKLNAVPSVEPDCAHVSSPLVNSEANGIFKELDVESLPNVQESGLTRMSENQLKYLAYILAKRLESNDSGVQALNLFFAHFYWRFRGNTRNALRCLLKYLQIWPNNISAKFQLGILLTKMANYEKAIELLEFVSQKLGHCAICLMPLGDAYVLSGNFDAAIKAFDKAFQLDNSLELGLKKASLLRCINKIFQVMEDQHSNLLHTIKDVETYNKKIRRIQELELLIEQKQAPVEAKLQAKLAYEFLEYGPLPYSSCREGTQWVNSGRERKRLYCTVSSWTKYNESVSQRRKERAVAQERERREEMLSLNHRVEEQKREKQSRREAEEAAEAASNLVELERYMDRLRPFVGMTLDEPQLEPKYNGERRRKGQDYSQQTWPSLEECQRAFDADELDGVGERERRLPELFLSPLNKGYLVAELLTKYLALGPDELTPLPWNLPSCAPHFPERDLDEKFRFILQLDIFKRIKDIRIHSSHEWAERSLKFDIYKLVDFDPKSEDNDDDFLSNQQQPLISEIGQRIGNLIRYGIGPKWISFNLAALYFRYLGIPSEAVFCLESALRHAENADIALTQLAQIFMRAFSLSAGEKNGQEVEAVQRILNISMSEAGVGNEPIPHHLMAVLYSMQNRSLLAEKELLKALEIEPEFQPSRRTLLNRKCTKRMTQRSRPFAEHYAPICCWPNEQEVYCFDTVTKMSIKKRRRRRTRCFRLEAQLDAPFAIKPVYFRCNTPYTGKSYPLPSFAKLLLPLLRPIDQLRALKEDQYVRDIEAQLAMKWKEKELPEIPVFPLDYGGYSLDRIAAHQRPLWPEGISREQMSQFRVDFPMPSADWEDGGPDVANANDQNEKSTSVQSTSVIDHPTTRTTTDAPMTTTVTQTSVITTTRAMSSMSAEQSRDGESKNENVNQRAGSKYFGRPKIDGTQLGYLQSRVDIMRNNFDIPMPDENLPVPPPELVDKGKRHTPSLDRAKLAAFCQGQKKSSQQLLEQPVSTWVSPTAKGVRIEEMLDLSSPMPDIAVEPECPEPALALDASSILLQLDDLPAYLYRHHLTKFYKPEKALRDTFRSIGASQLETVEHVAARLFFVNKAANSADEVHWALSTLASLYWRVKGDPVNAIRCLRHSLYNSPEKDVPLVSLANIYHQAGFLHSALFTLGKALETGRDVVAIHFTLANVYSTIGDYGNALKFYYSTLALQSSFEPAKLRIASIHCLTNGAFLEV